MTLSSDLFKRAQHHIPGGVNSPVRAFKSVGGEPIFIERANGAYLIDVDGNPYVDYIGSWGPMILGHNHPTVREAVMGAVERGLSYGAPTVAEIELADRLCALIPSIESVRMVNSGTEATMSAIRLARAFTQKSKIIKFNGCYHGHSDSLLVKAGSGALTLGVPSSPGVPPSFSAETLVAEYNDLSSVEILCDRHPDIAAIIVEPVAGNMNCILPETGFLMGLRQLCDTHNAVLIFDEVMTGFRVALGGAQALYNVTPDLTTLGKIIGGGLPVGAFGGRKDIMNLIAPQGPVYQAGTLSGNPVAMAAGLATLNEITKPGFYQELSVSTGRLVKGLLERAHAADVALRANQLGGMFGLFFTHDEVITRYQQVEQCDLTQFNAFFHSMLAQGVYMAPSAFEAGFVSSMHHEKEIQLTLDAAERSFSSSVLVV